MIVEIQDYFDLPKIIQSGQCFRAKEIQPGVFRFITEEDVLYIERVGTDQFSVSCNNEQWQKRWSPYFDLDRCYKDIYNEEYGKHAFVQKAMEYSRGIRVLCQDPWEMLVSFIISQRKSIPAISNSISALAMAFGHKIQTEYELLYSFPTPNELADVTEESLKQCSLGYRAPYLVDAIRKVLSNELDLTVAKGYDDERLVTELQNVHGVGKKVANCVALFGYGRTGCVPVDVWISRAITEECGGVSPFRLYGKNAGIIQQYIFYYEKSHRSS